MSWLRSHWELKLASVILACALWLWVVTSQKADLVMAATVELDSVPPGLAVVGERPDSVDVLLHGLRPVLARLAPGQLRARLSLTGVRPGEVVLRLLPEHVAVPAGVTVMRVSPSRVRVMLEPSRSSTVPVVARLTGALPDGYRVVRVSVIPASVAIEGPASAVARVERVETEPVDLSGATGPIERTAALGRLGESLRIAGERSVRVVVEVGREPRSGGPARPGGLPA